LRNTIDLIQFIVTVFIQWISGLWVTLATRHRPTCIGSSF